MSVQAQLGWPRLWHLQNLQGCYPWPHHASASAEWLGAAKIPLCPPWQGCSHPSAFFSAPTSCQSPCQETPPEHLRNHQSQILERSYCATSGAIAKGGAIARHMWYQLDRWTYYHPDSYIPRLIPQNNPPPQTAASAFWTRASTSSWVRLTSGSLGTALALRPPAGPLSTAWDACKASKYTWCTIY